MRVVEQIERAFDDRCPGVERGPGFREVCPYPFAFLRDCRQSSPNLARRQVAAGDEVEHVLFLTIERRERGVEVVARQPLSRLFVGQGSVQNRADPCSEPGWQSQGRVVVNHGRFDVFDRQVRQVAFMIRAGATHEVAVEPASALRVDEDEARFAASIVASAAPNGALEVMVVLTFAFTVAGGPSIENQLDLVVQRAVDQRLVPAGVLVTLVDDDTEVVAIPQNLRQRLR
ncbi:hypothetical protein [Nakamurella sp. PAMC28650]|uniref:hypothetical protein n=1 Tax=Nakamurella sp. PAMC28650 TaxID=2762325 RepID=UPI0021069166|nr:hypothetical protein [Nakamurella sp. PAMC28650]